MGTVGIMLAFYNKCTYHPDAVLSRLTTSGYPQGFHCRQLTSQRSHRNRQSVSCPRSLPACPFPGPALGALFPTSRLPCTLRRLHRGSIRTAACTMLQHHTWTQEEYLSAYQSYISSLCRCESVEEGKADLLGNLASHHPPSHFILLDLLFLAFEWPWTEGNTTLVVFARYQDGLPRLY